MGEVTGEVEQLKEKLRTIPKETPEYTHIERELLRLTEEKIEYCRQLLTGLSTLDSVKLNIEYTTMPEYVEEYFKVLDVAMKTVLLPYITEFESRKSHNEVIVDLKFLPHLNAFNMILTTEEGTVKYHSIRLPTYVKEVIPVVAAEQPIVEFIAKELEGKKEVKLFIHETEVVLKPTRAYTVQNKEYEILVDGQRIEIRPNERKEIPTKSSSVIL